MADQTDILKKNKNKNKVLSYTFYQSIELYIIKVKRINELKFFPKTKGNIFKITS